MSWALNCMVIPSLNLEHKSITQLQAMYLFMKQAILVGVPYIHGYLDNKLVAKLNSQMEVFIHKAVGNFTWLFKYR